MKLVVNLYVAMVAALSISSVESVAVDNKGGDPSMCTYQACGTCTGETVMLCAVGELTGCITPICSDVSFPAGKPNKLKDPLQGKAGGVKHQGIKK